MFKHQKKLLHPVKVKKPNPTYAALLQLSLIHIFLEFVLHDSASHSVRFALF